MTSDNKCAACTTILRKKLTFGNNSEITNIVSNQCDVANANKIYITDKSSLLDADIMKKGLCATGEIGVFEESVSSQNPITGEFTNAFSFPVFNSCVTNSPGLSFPDSTSTASNCLHFISSNGKYYCISCKKGYTGKILNDPVNNVNYVTCDTLISGC